MDEEPVLNNPGMDLLDAFLPFRETLRGLVAAFVADGFTDEQARELVVHVMTRTSTTEETE